MLGVSIETETGEAQWAQGAMTKDKGRPTRQMSGRVINRGMTEGRKEEEEEKQWVREAKDETVDGGGMK